jgi:cyclopropane-fatty-acyl-phospholipid synthase
VWLEDISPSYALTLRAWRERFTASSSRLEELGYDRRFRRLWELYFAISEAGFREARLSDVQMLCAKREWSGRVPGAGSSAAGDRRAGASLGPRAAAGERGPRLPRRQPPGPDDSLRGTPA